MEASGIGAISSGGAWPQVYGTAAAGQLPAQDSVAAAAGGSMSASQSLTSLSSTSINASSESLIATMTPSANNNELLGAVLLMLIMEYMKTDDKQQKQDLMGLATLLLQQQQQQSAGAQTIMYNSSSLSIESTQIQVASSEMAISAYSGAAATLQQAPNIDAGAAGLNVVA
jgi:hypothetical protein